MLYPFTFEPIFQERIWGGRRLETLYRKTLPSGKSIGESWEICDRPDTESIITNGPLKGHSLRWLMENHQGELLGDYPSKKGRFPWLAKMLDAEADLSVQVHPPAAIAKALKGEPKTEAWFIAHAEPSARLIAGLSATVTEAQFNEKIGQPDFADCLHHIPAQADRSLFIPSGRLHALGAGTVVFEIQENSDTTYRIYDWDRTGLDGQPRDLHIDQALKAIDFEDHEPTLCPANWSKSDGFSSYLIADQPEIFRLSHVRMDDPVRLSLPGKGPRLIAVTHNSLALNSKNITLELAAGQFALVPASAEEVTIQGQPARFLLTQPA